MKRRFLLMAAIVLLACFAALAQQENARALRQYNWKSRTEVRKGGETKSMKLYMARSVMSYPDKELSVVTDNFDYARER